MLFKGFYIFDIVVVPNNQWCSFVVITSYSIHYTKLYEDAGFAYIENHSFESSFQGLFSEINLNSEKLGKKPAERNAKLCTIIQKISDGIAEFSNESDILGDAYEYLIGEFAAGSGKKAGEFYTPQPISKILSEIVTSYNFV